MPFQASAKRTLQRFRASPDLHPFTRSSLPGPIISQPHYGMTLPNRLALQQNPRTFHLASQGFRSQLDIRDKRLFGPVHELGLLPRPPLLALIYTIGSCGLADCLSMYVTRSPRKLYHMESDSERTTLVLLMTEDMTLRVFANDPSRWLMHAAQDGYGRTVFTASGKGFQVGASWVWRIIRSSI